jgi:hypothetical protein
MDALTIPEEGTVDRSPLNILDVLCSLQGDILIETRAIEREFQRLTARPRIEESIMQRLAVLRDDRDRLLTSLLWHRQEHAHMPDDCAICDRSVSL